MDPLIIYAQGNDRQIGQQHARATLMMREDVARWVDSTGQLYSLDNAITRNRVDQVVAAWSELTPGTLEQISGMAEVYELPEEGLLTAVLTTYLRSMERAPGSPEGCTTFAVSAQHPLLVKNRDNDPRFLQMQTVLQVTAEDGHPWLALSTAGAPGVHSSGMNAVGLCVADTHVPSNDVGPGVPRFASMMHLLERCSNTTEAVDYLLSTPQMGLGNLTLLDADGNAAVVECGYSASEASPVLPLRGAGGAAGVVATNHFTSALLSSCLLEPEDGTPGVNSRARADVVSQFLSRTDGSPADTAAVRELAGGHVGLKDSNTLDGSLCQHGPDLKSETISTTIYDPVDLHLDLCLGRPCTESYTRISLH